MSHYMKITKVIYRYICVVQHYILQIFKRRGLDCVKLMPICFKDYPFKAKRSQYSCLSITKLNSYINLLTWQ